MKSNWNTQYTKLDKTGMKKFKDTSSKTITSWDPKLKHIQIQNVNYSMTVLKETMIEYYLLQD